MKKIIAFLVLLSIISVGCELYKQDNYKEYYVVESYLIADGTLPMVRLSTTSPVEEKYNFKENALGDANVQINLLNPDSTVVERYPYFEQQSGIYKPDNPSTIVKGEQLYRLHVTTTNGDTITSTTYVPGNFENRNELHERYEYQSEKQVIIRATPSSYITGRQSYFIFTVNAVDPDSSKLTPFYRDLVVDQDNDIENYYINSSGIVNERNSARNPDDTITLPVPWLAIAFYEENDIIVNAIDDNMYDFLRTQDVQTGGSNLAPGEIQNIRYNVNGGIGIFGSMASDTNRVYISRPQNSN